MMKAVALVLVGVVAVSALSEFEYQNMFTGWIAENNKEYSHDEFFSRYNTFKANVDLIDAHNAKNSTYKLVANKFADLNTEEFGATFCGFKPQLRANARFPVAYTAAQAAEVDWIKAGAVTPVKDQGQCGSCWAFSATGGIEGAVQIAKGGVVVSVSEQQLVDCSGSEGNQGCNGGLMDYAFAYVIKNKGIASQKEYPYTARDGTCKKKPSVSSITGFEDVAQGDEEALLAAVEKQPVPVAIEADQPCFQFYHAGILDDDTCGENLDHGVLAVGYATEGGVDYWRVKNSWGTSWGDKGYIKFVRGKNQCGIAAMASYPTV